MPGLMIIVALPLLLIAVALDARVRTKRMAVLVAAGELTAERYDELSGKKLRRQLLIATGVALLGLVGVMVYVALL
ncbi:MAG TPA: hypothetical protein VJO13_13675 [Ktedonobacterales bacterium]|nr:hypothetical protein [Ktedonobacterales bacterium]